MSDLLPCPFCGGKATMNDFGTYCRAGCEECVIETPRFSSYDKAIAAWNKRVQKTPVCHRCQEESSQYYCNNCLTYKDI